MWGHDVYIGGDLENIERNLNMVGGDLNMVGGNLEHLGGGWFIVGGDIEPFGVDLGIEDDAFFSYKPAFNKGIPGFPISLAIPCIIA